MSELVVVGFDTTDEADRALTELQRMQTEYLVDLEDAVVVIRAPDGKLRMKQSVDLIGREGCRHAVTLKHPLALPAQAEE